MDCLAQLSYSLHMRVHYVREILIHDVLCMCVCVGEGVENCVYKTQWHSERDVIDLVSSSIVLFLKLNWKLLKGSFIKKSIMSCMDSSQTLSFNWISQQSLISMAVQHLARCSEWRLSPVHIFAYWMLQFFSTQTTICTHHINTLLNNKLVWLTKWINFQVVRTSEIVPVWWLNIFSMRLNRSREFDL